MTVIIFIGCFCIGLVATMLGERLIRKVKYRRAYVAELERTVAWQRRSLEFYRLQREIKK